MARPIDPFREMERLMTGFARTSGAASMPMNLYREGDVFVAEVELPGVDPSSIDVDVEERTLTVRAERKEAPPGRTVAGSPRSVRPAPSPASSTSARAWPWTRSRPTTATACCC